MDPAARDAERGAHLLDCGEFLGSRGRQFAEERSRIEKCAEAARSALRERRAVASERGGGSVSGESVVPGRDGKGRGESGVTSGNGSQAQEGHGPRNTEAKKRETRGS